mgnify:CR=1 FL=1
MVERSFIEKCYKDEKGKVTLYQLPNLPIIVWFVSMLASRIISEGLVHDTLSLISFGALFTWAWLELFSGVNYLRRILGLVVLVLTLMSRIKN